MKREINILLLGSRSSGKSTILNNLNSFNTNNKENILKSSNQQQPYLNTINVGVTQSSISLKLEKSFYTQLSTDSTTKIEQKLNLWEQKSFRQQDLSKFDSVLVLADINQQQSIQYVEKTLEAIKSYNANQLEQPKMTVYLAINKIDMGINEIAFNQIQELVTKYEFLNIAFVSGQELTGVDRMLYQLSRFVLLNRKEFLDKQNVENQSQQQILSQNIQKNSPQNALKKFKQLFSILG